MKTSLSLLLLLSAGFASAQFGEGRRADPAVRAGGGEPRLEGRYEAFQLGRTIHRTLRLDRDGTAEIVTEVRSDRGQGDRGRADTGRGRFQRFGRLAVQASEGAPVRQSGRWERRRGVVALRLEAVDQPRRVDRRPGAFEPNDGGRKRIELTLERRDDGFVLQENSGLYGREDVLFRPDLGRDRGDRREFGRFQYDREGLDIDAFEYTEVRGEGRLKVRSGGRSFDLRGEARRRGDEVTLRLVGARSDREDAGTLVLSLRGDRVIAVSGTGNRDGHRFDFNEVRGNR